MSRTKWKGPIITLQNNKIKKIKLLKRSDEIVPQFIGLTVLNYNGKKHVKLTITEEMIGYKFGAFTLTREQFSFKKKKSKK